MGKIKTYLVQITIGIILLEILLRCLYFQKLGNDFLAIVAAYKSVSFRATDDYRERLINNHNRLRPDSVKVNEDIVDEVIASNSFEYAPWAEFKLIDFAGHYVNSKGFLRKSIPDRSGVGSTDPIRLYLFGGSTMFGFDVMDKETIPSALTRIYAKRCAGCQPIEVYNYGVLSYYSYNELMLLHHLLSTGHRPDVAIFLDGLNDFFIVQAARKRLPWYYFRLKENIQNRKDSTLSLFQLTPDQTTESAADEVIANYLENADHIRKLCKIYDVEPFFFIQPNPYFEYPAQQKDPVSDTSRNPMIAYGYPLLKLKCDSLSNMFFLGNMLQHETGLPFIDEIHYSPRMNENIAEEIYRLIQPKLNTISPSISGIAAPPGNKK